MLVLLSIFLPLVFVFLIALVAIIVAIAIIAVVVLRKKETHEIQGNLFHFYADAGKSNHGENYSVRRKSGVSAKESLEQQSSNLVVIVW